MQGSRPAVRPGGPGPDAAGVHRPPDHGHLRKNPQGTRMRSPSVPVGSSRCSRSRQSSRGKPAIGWAATCACATAGPRITRTPRSSWTPTGSLRWRTSEPGGWFGLDAKHVGQPFHDLELSFRPVELRSRIEQTLGERRTVRIADAERALPSGEVQHLNVDVIPLMDHGRNPIGVLIVFTDATELHRLRAEHNRSAQELETA